MEYEVENALLSSALEDNTTAQIFWLKNRRPDKWRDKQKEETDKTALDKLDSILKEIKDERRGKRACRVQRQKLHKVRGNPKTAQT